MQTMQRLNNYAAERLRYERFVDDTTVSADRHRGKRAQDQCLDS
jgi:hypothetical protein